MKWTKRYNRLSNAVHLTVLLMAVAFVSVAEAKTTEERGYEIAARSDRSERGFTDSVVYL